jgi:hypothetical protein
MSEMPENRKEIPLVRGRGHASDQGGGHPGTRDKRGSYSPEQIGNEEEHDAGEEIGADEPT